ncbi:MAG: ubiquinol-cytochrome C chaperone family protein [Pseudomonadota bacterium]
MYERLKEMVAKLAGGGEERRHAHALYVAIAEAARRPEFYARWRVPDTTEGRYELLSVHMILTLRRLRAGGDATARFSQLLFDVMFRDVDDTLREMGVGDMRVGKKVRGYAEAFLGRAGAYDLGLDREADLKEAIARNVYGDLDEPFAQALADYMYMTEDALQKQALEALLGGTISFPEPSFEERSDDD